MSLAIRIKGKILLSWITVISRYNIRPRYYLFNKNDFYLRHIPTPDPEPEQVTPIVATDIDPLTRTFISTPEIVRLETAMLDPRAKFHFKATKKGGLGVYIHEIKEEAV